MGYIPSKLLSCQHKKKMIIYSLFRLVEWVLFFHFKHKIIVSSQSDKKYIQRTHSVCESNIHVLNSFVPDIFFVSNISKKGTAAFVGRLSQEKGFLEALNFTEKQGINLHVIGDGPLRHMVDKAVQRTNTVYYGNLNQKKVVEVLKQSRFFVLLSPHEGFPKALVEAIAAGCIPLVIDSPGINDVVIHKENGFFIDKMSLQEINELLTAEKPNTLLANYGKLPVDLRLAKAVETLIGILDE